MKLKTLFAVTLLFSSAFLNAQTDFKPAYIIELSGDTLWGEIDYRGDLLKGHTCKFRDKTGAVTDYSPNSIFAFRFIDGKYYV